MVDICLSSGAAVSAQHNHSCVADLEGDADLLSDVEALGHRSELVELEVEGEICHALSDAVHEPF